jgi:hypothetical protein
MTSFLRFLYHTQQRTTVGRTPLDEWSARRRDLYLTAHNTHNRQTSMPPVRFEPTISADEPSQTSRRRRAVADEPSQTSRRGRAVADEPSQTYALDRAVTGTGKLYISTIKNNGFALENPGVTGYIKGYKRDSTNKVDSMAPCAVKIGCDPHHKPGGQKHKETSTRENCNHETELFHWHYLSDRRWRKQNPPFWLTNYQVQNLTWHLGPQHIMI